MDENDSTPIAIDLNFWMQRTPYKSVRNVPRWQTNLASNMHRKQLHTSDQYQDVSPGCCLHEPRARLLRNLYLGHRREHVHLLVVDSTVCHWSQGRNFEKYLSKCGLCHSLLSTISSGRRHWYGITLAPPSILVSFPKSALQNSTLPERATHVISRGAVESTRIVERQTVFIT